MRSESSPSSRKATVWRVEDSEVVRNGEDIGVWPDASATPAIGYRTFFRPESWPSSLRIKEATRVGGPC